ncbi:cyclic nucleotide-binding domain-containing protein, partial [Acinetobacter junii]|uniref:cyclic nucleotide-binding domain-containing protein n=1 Tax=Acinetobacter junii TaxID=40215 RepID=UPI00102EA484
MDIIKTLSKVKLFHELKPESLLDLAQFCSVKHLQTGHQLYDLDDLPLHVYIIAHGRVKLTTRTNLSTYLGRHEIVGEMGVISNQPHHGRVIATRDTCLIEIPQQQFTAFLQKHPQV